MSQNQQSFDRIAVLKVFNRQVSPGQNGSSILNNVDKTGKAFASKLSDGSTGFRITFRVEKLSGPVPIPNPVVISIYNIGADSRALVSKVNNFITLEVGYGQNPQLIFSGNILRAITRKEGPDYITKIEAADGLFAFQNSMINQSFGKGVSVGSVVNNLIGSLTGGGVSKGQVQVPEATYNQGIVISGKAVDRLREICDRHDLNFSIQDGKVTILPYGSNNGIPAFVISPETGLIGIPEIRESDTKGNNLISFRCLLNQKIVPFQQVVLISKFVNGAYSCAKVTHSGDSWGGPWFTDAEASNQVESV